MIRIWLCLAFVALPALAQAPLPVGAAPAPVEFPHFPSRVHALVWRNWNLVESERLAKVLGTDVEHVRACAASMGLEGEPPIPVQYRSRLYLSVIRRNWHLLPYKQLLTLLDVSAEQLAHTLREDDFLYVKLGSLKPNCVKLTWSDPDEAAVRRAAEIKSIVEREFRPTPNERVEPALAFLDELSKPIADGDVRPTKSDLAHPRFLYSYCAVFGDPLLDPALDPFPDTLLQRYADLGVNGVWLHTVLRDLAPSNAFGEFGKDADKRLANLAKLVARAKRFGIGIYLYTNEPRAMPTSWFAGDERRRGLAGVAEGAFTALCTSTPEVRQWLAESLTYVFTKVPDLAGVFTITASENLTNCTSHGQQQKCPRCKERKPAEIIAEVNATIEAAVHKSAPKANVIVWDWGWPDAIAADVIAALPKDVFLQSVSEWSLPIERGGVRTTVGEYSISAVGPGPRATKHWQLAKSRGLRTVAKVQANNTWELSAVPNLPALDLIARHATGLAAADVDGLMLSWSLGGYPSANLELFQRVTNKEPADAVLDDLARRTFGAAGVREARAAWSLFSAAFEQFPYSGSVVYQAPLQVGPANLLFATPTGYRATMVGLPYDDLNGWRGPYPADVFIGQLDKVAQTWQLGLTALEAAARAAPPDLAGRARRELHVAQAAYLHFASVAAQSRFIQSRGTPAAKAILEEEAGRAKTLYRLQREDSRVGFEASNHYYYLPQDLQEKVLNCR